MFFFSSMSVFLLMILLVHIYHLYNWKNSLTSMDKVWASSFECGFLNFSSPYSSFTYGFMSFLVMFVLFDLEMSLFLKFCYNKKFHSNFIYYYYFILLLCISFTFELMSGKIKWSL